MVNPLEKKAAQSEVAVEIILDPQVRANRRNVAMERNDIEWYVDQFGAMKLRFRDTKYDVLFKRLRRRDITQAEIDRIPDHLKRVAWNMCLLNYDYEGNYYLPKPSIHDWVPADDEASNEPCTAEQAAAIMKEFKIESLKGLPVA
jgi:hypothetical protein